MMICLAGMVSYGQTKYKVTGKVKDASNGSPLVGASVMVENTRGGVRTDVEGNFFIILEGDKTYNLQISNIGYQSKIINGIQPSKEGNEPIHVSLEHESATLSIVVVRSSARRESIASLYSVQKNSSSISDGISAESIQRSPDRNTGEVLKRVSGTSVQDNKFVVIRGLSERYNTSLLNNSILPSTEPDKKAFAFDIIPSSLIDNVTIYKSPTPDLPGDFAGGAVKVTTRDYPSKSLSQLTFIMGYNTLTTFKPFYKSDPPGQIEPVSYFNHNRQMPNAYYNNKGAGFINLPDEEKLAITRQFPNTYAYLPASSSPPNFSLSYTGGNTTLIGNNKLGYIYSIGYTASHRVADRTRQEYETYNVLDYTNSTVNYDTRSVASALLNLSYSYRKSKISLKTLFNNDFVKTIAIRGGENISNSAFPFSTQSSSTEATANGIGTAVVEGLHSLNRSWTIDWNGSFSTVWRWQPDQTILAFQTDPNSSQYYLTLTNENSPNIANAGRVYSYLTEDIYGANINVTKTFNWHGQPQKFKFGTANYYRDRNVEVDALGYASLDAGFSILKIPVDKDFSTNTAFTPINLDQYKMLVANIGTNSTSYTGTALLNAGYVMLDNKFSDKIKLIWGVRVENYNQELKAAGKENIVLNNLDFLPSFLFTYAVNNKANIRAAASQSVNRPEFRELATYRVYDYENNFILQGNDTLVRSKNTNVDLRYEWFPAPGEIISASIFYKYFDHPIEQTNQGNDVLSWVNADNANVYGIEAEFRKSLGFIKGDFFNNLVFYANAAYMDGSVRFDTSTFSSPMQGQSPYLINGGLNYSTDNNSLSFNVLYNIIGPRLRFRAIGGAGKNIFEEPRNVLDFQVSKKLMDGNLELKLTISDILAEPYTWYYKYQADPTKLAYEPSQDRILNTVKYGTSFYLALRYNF
jgi:TonB-dependent receptor